jgi:hypothetical protein
VLEVHLGEPVSHLLGSNKGKAVVHVSHMLSVNMFWTDCA